MKKLKSGIQVREITVLFEPFGFKEYYQNRPFPYLYNSIFHIGKVFISFSLSIGLPAFGFQIALFNLEKYCSEGTNYKKKINWKTFDFLCIGGIIRIVKEIIQLVGVRAFEKKGGFGLLKKMEQKGGKQ